MRSDGDLDISETTLIILNRYNIYSVSSSTDIISGRHAPGQQTIARPIKRSDVRTEFDSTLCPQRGPRRLLETEGDDMDVLLRMLLGSHRWDVAQRCVACGLIEPPNDPASQSRQEQWRRGKWCSLSYGS